MSRTVRLSARWAATLFTVHLFAAAPLPSQTSGSTTTQPGLCRVNSSREASSTRVRDLTYEAFVQRLRSDTLPDTGPNGVFGLRSMSVNRQGKILVVDSRQRKVTLRNAELQTIATVGQQGEGPGEYRIPTFGVYSTDDRLLLLDDGLSRLSVYSASGKFLHVVPRTPANARELLPLNDSTFLVLGASPKPVGYDIATVMTMSGRKLWQGVAADAILQATRMIVDDVWGTRSADGTVVLGVSISPNVQRIDATTGQVLCRSAIPSAFWTQLDPGKRPASGDRKAVQAWIEPTSFIVRATALPDGRLIVATQRSDALGEPVNEWIVFGTGLEPLARIKNVPGRLVLARGDTVWLAAEADDGRARLVRGIVVGAKSAR